MVYLLGHNIDENKAVCVGLTKIYGIGKSRAKQLCKKVGIDPWSKMGSLSMYKVRELAREIRAKYVIDVELRRYVYNTVRKEMDMRSYKGLRHRYRLPVNGQRTRSNGRNAKFLVGKGGDRV